MRTKLLLAGFLLAAAVHGAYAQCNPTEIANVDLTWQMNTMIDGNFTVAATVCKGTFPSQCGDTRMYQYTDTVTNNGPTARTQPPGALSYLWAFNVPNCQSGRYCAV